MKFRANLDMTDKEWVKSPFAKWMHGSSHFALPIAPLGGGMGENPPYRLSIGAGTVHACAKKPAHKIIKFSKTKTPQHPRRSYAT